MIIKVNRVCKLLETQELINNGVDIIGISVKISDQNIDKRALTISELMHLKSQIHIENLSLNLNIEEYRLDDVERVVNIVKPQSLNLFIEAHTISRTDSANEFIKVINRSKIDIIAYGNGYGYDGPTKVPRMDHKLENIKYLELEFHTLGENSNLKIKSRNEWANFTDIPIVQITDQKFDAILDSIVGDIDNRPFLVDDENLHFVTTDKLSEIGASGITMSIGDNINNKINSRNSALNSITNNYSLQQILELASRFK